MIDAFERGGGKGKKKHLKVQLSYARSREQAVAGAYDQWRTNVLSHENLGNFSQPEHFDKEAENVTMEQLEKMVHISSDPQEFVQWIRQYVSNRIIEVNIPEFMLNVYEGTSKAFDMKVVVGKEGASTTMFTGDLNQIVFSPYWNIPQSIVKDEIMPKVKNDPKYLLPWLYVPLLLHSDKARAFQYFRKPSIHQSGDRPGK